MENSCLKIFTQSRSQLQWWSAKSVQTVVFSMITASNVNINDSFGILKTRAIWNSHWQLNLIKCKLTKVSLKEAWDFRSSSILNALSLVKLCFAFSLRIIKKGCWSDQKHKYQKALDLRIPKLSLMLTFDAVIMEKSMFVQILLTATVTETLIE